MQSMVFNFISSTLWNLKIGKHVLIIRHTNVQIHTHTRVCYLESYFILFRYPTYDLFPTIAITKHHYFDIQLAR